MTTTLERKRYSARLHNSPAVFVSDGSHSPVGAIEPSNRRLQLTEDEASRARAYVDPDISEEDQKRVKELLGY